MRVTVLVILYRGKTTITLHDDESSASFVLMEFLQANWFERFGENLVVGSLLPDECARKFFSDADGMHVLAEADLSEIEDQIDAMLGAEGSMPASQLIARTDPGITDSD